MKNIIDFPAIVGDFSKFEIFTKKRFRELISNSYQKKTSVSKVI